MMRMSLSLMGLARLLAGVLWISGCQTDLGDCDQESAETVYVDRGEGESQQRAHGGQALVHVSCGAGGFCHASAATGSRRSGAPAGLDFDVLESAGGVDHGIAEVRDWKEESWNLVENDDMPPGEEGTRLAQETHDRFAFTREADAEPLPRISTDAGKEILRNWLACGAPLAP